jgi:hypothetical protein
VSLSHHDPFESVTDRAWLSVPEALSDRGLGRAEVARDVESKVVELIFQV